MGPPVEAGTALLEAVVAARLVPPPPTRSLLRGCEIPLLKPYLVPKSQALKGSNGPMGVVVDVVVGNTKDGGCEVVVEAVGNGPEL